MHFRWSKCWRSGGVWGGGVWGDGCCSSGLLRVPSMPKTSNSSFFAPCGVETFVKHVMFLRPLRHSPLTPYADTSASPYIRLPAMGSKTPMGLSSMNLLPISLSPMGLHEVRRHCKSYHPPWEFFKIALSKWGVTTLLIFLRKKLFGKISFFIIVAIWKRRQD